MSRKCCAKPVTPADVERGWVPCDCGKFAHILSAAGMRQWPDGYSGELCAECGFLVAALDLRQIAAPSCAGERGSVD